MCHYLVRFLLGCQHLPSGRRTSLPATAPTSSHGTALAPASGSTRATASPSPWTASKPGARVPRACTSPRKRKLGLPVVCDEVGTSIVHFASTLALQRHSLPLRYVVQSVVGESDCCSSSSPKRQAHVVVIERATLHGNTAGEFVAPSTSALKVQLNRKRVLASLFPTCQYKDVSLSGMSARRHPALCCTSANVPFVDSRIEDQRSPWLWRGWHRTLNASQCPCLTTPPSDPFPGRRRLVLT